MILEQDATLSWSAGTIEIDGGTWTMGTNNGGIGIGCSFQDMTLRLLNGGSVTTQTIDVCDLGLIEGTGTLAAAVSNGGTVQPGTSAGTLSISGNYEQSADGALAMEIGGAAPGLIDVLNVSGTAMLDGHLQVTFINGYVPVLNDAWTLATGSSISGALAS